MTKSFQAHCVMIPADSVHISFYTDNSISVTVAIAKAQSDIERVSMGVVLSIHDTKRLMESLVSHLSREHVVL